MKPLLALFPMLVLVLLTIILLPITLVSTLLTVLLWSVGGMIGEEANRIRWWAKS